MAPIVDYRSFIQDNFFIKNKHGILVPFIFNDVQNLWYEELITDYGPELQGIRENDLKGRQFGISSVIEAMFCTDFILSELGELPIIDSDVYSHKDDETTAHIQRFNLFLNSFLVKSQGGGIADMDNMQAITALRKAFLRADSDGELIGRARGAQYHAETASAKVSGRGGTKQNIHWTEPAFYPNTEIMSAKKLMTGAEEQVPDGHGKIFRETTGNMMGDYFSEEYYAGKDGIGDFKSRFIVWYLHKAYSKPAPADWASPPYYAEILRLGLATRDQCYWHFRKTKGLQDKEKLREYPTYDYEAFLAAGTSFFDTDALLFHRTRIRPAIKETMYVKAL